MIRPFPLVLGDMHSFLIAKGSFIKNTFNKPQQFSFFLEASNLELITTFTMNIFYESYTPLVEKGYITLQLKPVWTVIG